MDFNGARWGNGGDVESLFSDEIITVITKHPSHDKMWFSFTYTDNSRPEKFVVFLVAASLQGRGI